MFGLLNKSLNEITVVHNSGLPSMTMIVSTDIYEKIKAGFPEGGGAPLNNLEAGEQQATAQA